MVNAKYLEKWKKGKPVDDWFFKELMGQEALCRAFLNEVIPGKNFGKLKITTQDETDNGHNKKVIFDILAIDEKANYYNIGMQIVNQHNLLEWSLYYQSMMITNMLNPGESYRDLHYSYVIFLCEFDPLEEGDRVITTLERRIVENPTKELADKTRVVFINMNGDLQNVGGELRGFIQALKEELPSNSNSQLGKQLMADFKELKGNEKGRNDFMFFTEKEQKAIEQKRDIKIATLILNDDDLPSKYKIKLLTDILGDENQARNLIAQHNKEAVH